MRAARNNMIEPPHGPPQLASEPVLNSPRTEALRRAVAEIFAAYDVLAIEPSTSVVERTRLALSSAPAQSCPATSLLHPGLRSSCPTFNNPHEIMTTGSAGHLHRE